MTDKRRQEIKALLDGIGAPDFWTLDMENEKVRYFMARAPTIVADLLAEVERLRAVLSNVCDAVYEAAVYMNYNEMVRIQEEIKEALKDE